MTTAKESWLKTRRLRALCVLTSIVFPSALFRRQLRNCMCFQAWAFFWCLMMTRAGLAGFVTVVWLHAHLIAAMTRSVCCVCVMS